MIDPFAVLAYQSPVAERATHSARGGGPAVADHHEDDEDEADAAGERAERPQRTRPREADRGRDRLHVEEQEPDEREQRVEAARVQREDPRADGADAREREGAEHQPVAVGAVEQYAPEDVQEADDHQRGVEQERHLRDHPEVADRGAREVVARRHRRPSITTVRKSPPRATNPSPASRRLRSAVRRPAAVVRSWVESSVMGSARTVCR
jgi:hypothetical protein